MPSLAAALGTLPTVAVPRQDHLLGLLAVYVLLLGPISYLVLRRLDLDRARELIEAAGA